MAEFLNNVAPALEATPESGFNAMGQPVPIHRRSAAMRHCADMGLTDTARAWQCVGAVAERLERDQPYEAMAEGMRYLDLTGTYRLIAALLCDSSPTPRKGKG